jgi:hypothetical protein
MTTDNMQDKTKKRKDKKGTKVQDLKPKKDAKGGRIGFGPPEK